MKLLYLLKVAMIGKRNPILIRKLKAKQTRGSFENLFEHEIIVKPSANKIDKVGQQINISSSVPITYLGASSCSKIVCLFRGPWSKYKVFNGTS